jgi:hypothetical protein
MREIPLSGRRVGANSNAHPGCSRATQTGPTCSPAVRHPKDAEFPKAWAAFVRLRKIEREAGS